MVEIMTSSSEFTFLPPRYGIMKLSALFSIFINSGVPKADLSQPRKKHFIKIPPCLYGAVLCLPVFSRFLSLRKTPYMIPSWRLLRKR